jgi:hypothetical protein
MHPMPKPGYSTCFATKRTDAPAHKGLFAAATTPHAMDRTRTRGNDTR